MLEITLPYPPSVNHYWRHVGPRVLISREGRLYRDQVRSILGNIGIEQLTGNIAVKVDVHPPDNRRRDLDNTMKALLDSLQYGGAYIDDSQIVDLHAIKQEVDPNGKVVVRVKRAVPKKPKPVPVVITGACESCGVERQILLNDWLTARRRDSWPCCKECDGHIFPLPRKCTGCGAVLRNGNFDTTCAPCQLTKFQTQATAVSDSQSVSPTA